MIRAIRAAGWVLTAALIAAACADAEDDADDAALEQAPPAVGAASISDVAPDTTAAALWAHLEQQGYRESWSLWPGKDRLYAGTEPHGMLLTTYVNRTAHGALLAGDVADLPDGSIIVKENWTPDSTFAAATVMYKVDGFSPDHQDWVFAKYDPQGSAEAFGRAPMCQACHQDAESGYIYTPVQR